MLLFEEESYAIIGTCIDVHKKMGNGFSDDVYREVLEKEFIKRKIPFEREKKLDLYYDGIQLDNHFTADFVCNDKILIEVKSADCIKEEATRQTVNSLKATNFELGLLINFGEVSLKWKRLINTPIPI